jgi:glycosyltransferase involved in cell wall biosynthesis
MRLGLDLRMIGGGSGLDRYMTELFHEILNQDKTNEYVLFFRNIAQAESFKTYGHKIVIKDVAHYSFSEQFIFPFVLMKEKLDLVHFPHFNVPLLYRKQFVVTIHDLTHTLIPGKKKSHFIHRIAYNLVFLNAIKSATKIIAVSNATKNSILDYFKIDSNKITVVYEGFKQIYGVMDKDQAFNQISNRFGITKPYILYVGEWRRYKNLPQLALAFDELIKQGLDLEMVLVGKKDPFYPEIEEEIFSIKHKDRIKALGRITDEELKAVYNAATLFVLPSSMEGFGLTLLEAAACGVPITCSDIPSLREVAGQAAEYFDPNNLDNMIDVMKNLLNKPERLEELANLALARSKHFSWKKAAEETMEVYK